MLIVYASVTDSLVTLATHIVRDLGLAGVALLTMTSGVIGAPGSEPTMLFAGFNVSEGHLSMFGIIVAGVFGDMLGASIAYAIGYWGREELVERHGNKLHISKRRLDRAHSWFERYGAPVILVSRFIPFARAAFPYAAGVARMGYGRFLIFGTIGSIIWISALGVLGNAVGSSWQSWRHNLEYVDYVGAAVLVIAIAYLIVRITRSRRGDPTAVA
ncbi:MAG TPA: DedA family protein [Solirubrobacteraceae bacterium]|nr:DedA family protein [Solirubrobacteraceae bacterium]